MYKKIIYLILLLDISFFYLIPLGPFSSIISNYQKIAITFIIAFFIFICSKSIFSKEKYLFIKEIFFFLILILGEILLSYISYKQGIISIIKMANHFFIISGYFILSKFIKKKDENIYILQKIIIIFTLTVSTLFIIQYFIYNITGSISLFIDKSRTMSTNRFNGIRIYESGYFITVGCILALGNYLKESNKYKFRILCLITFIISLIQIVIVSKGRMGLLFVSIASFVMVLVKQNRNLIKIMKIFAISIVLFNFIIKIPVIENFILSISSEDYSLITRSNAIEFYMKQVKEKPIFGTGFIDPIEGEESYYMVRGPYGKYYKSDMGILGILNIFGIIGFIWFIWISIKVSNVLTRLYIKGKSTDIVELYGLFVLMIVGSIVMNPFDIQRIVMFPFFISFIEYANENICKGMKKYEGTC